MLLPLVLSLLPIIAITNLSLLSASLSSASLIPTALPVRVPLPSRVRLFDRTFPTSRALCTHLPHFHPHTISSLTCPSHPFLSSHYCPFTLLAHPPFFPLTSPTPRPPPLILPCQQPFNPLILTILPTLLLTPLRTPLSSPPRPSLSQQQSLQGSRGGQPCLYKRLGPLHHLLAAASLRREKEDE
ncbi:unnamed protein product [Closterium sp. NIES-54]